MANLPQFQSDDVTFQMMQSKWGSILNPVISNPTTNPLILKNISLQTGTNVINHKLQRMQQGWIVADINNSATIYRSQPFNEITLTLTSSAPATITLLVY